MISATSSWIPATPWNSCEAPFNSIANGADDGIYDKIVLLIAVPIVFPNPLSNFAIVNLDSFDCKSSEMISENTGFKNLSIV